jgi:hypothetical protein
MRAKVVLVTYAMGRCGSSATMGLLKVMGVSVGAEERLIGARPMNPKGFFELKSQERFLRHVFPDFYPSVDRLPSQDIITAAVARWAPMFMAMLAAEFSAAGVFALKTQRGLALPFWRRLRDQFDVRVLVLSRDRADQVKSIRRVWSQLDDPARRGASEAEISAYIDRWNGFLETRLAEVEFPRLRLTFEDVIAQPQEVARRLADFLELAPPLSALVDVWIDRRLVNRPAYAAE